jgi:transcriptional regulator with PAS, ATPase and Fis domain
VDGHVLGPDNLEIDGPERETGLLEESARAARDRELQLIQRALRETGGNRKKAAEILKVSYRTLMSRLKELDL